MDSRIKIDLKTPLREIKINVCEHSYQLYGLRLVDYLKEIKFVQK